MSRPDLDPHVRDAWARTSAETVFAALPSPSDLQAQRAEHQRLAARTRALHGHGPIHDSTDDFSDDCDPWDTLSAAVRFVFVLLIVLACAGLGLFAGLYLEQF